MKRFKKSSAVALGLTLALFGAACSSDDDAANTTTTEEATATTAMEESGNIVELVVGNDDLSTLEAAVKEAGLVETLQGEGPFTVFAPTNEAFAALPQDKLQALLADKEKLTAVLTYHVLPSEVPASAVAELEGVEEGTDVNTVESSPVKIMLNGMKVMVNDATVVTADVEASNGVVHVIDKVLLPPNVTL